MKLPSLVTLMSSIVCIDSCRVKITFIRSVNKAWEVGRVLIQKPYLLSQVKVVNAILNQDISLLGPQTLIVHFNYIKFEYLAN